MNKYGAKRTWSELCRRTFDSKAEAKRGEELRLLEMAGEIKHLMYQYPFPLCEKPKVTIKIDFRYLQPADDGRFYEPVFEDVKGKMTREFRVKLAWLKEKYGIDVKLIRKEE